MLVADAILSFAVQYGWNSVLYKQEPWPFLSAADPTPNCDSGAPNRDMIVSIEVTEGGGVILNPNASILRIRYVSIYRK